MICFCLVYLGDERQRVDHKVCVDILAVINNYSVSIYSKKQIASYDLLSNSYICKIEENYEIHTDMLFQKYILDKYILVLPHDMGYTFYLLPVSESIRGCSLRPFRKKTLKEKC